MRIEPVDTVLSDRTDFITHIKVGSVVHKVREINRLPNGQYEFVSDAGERIKRGRGVVVNLFTEKVPLRDLR